MTRPSKESSIRRFQSENEEDQVEAGKWAYLLAVSYGLDVEWMTKSQGFGIVQRLKRGMDPLQAADEMKLKSVTMVGPSKAQVDYLRKLNLPYWRVKNKREAGLVLDAHFKPLKIYNRLLRQIDKALTGEELDIVGRDVWRLRGVLPAEHQAALIEAGQKRREELGPRTIPE